MNASVKLALAARKLAQAPKDRTVIVDGADDPAKLGVFAGHRAGKRRRGVSVTKRKPKEQARAKVYEVRDADGNLVGRVQTITYKRDA